MTGLFTVSGARTKTRRLLSGDQSGSSATRIPEAMTRIELFAPSARIVRSTCCTPERPPTYATVAPLGDHTPLAIVPPTVGANVCRFDPSERIKYIAFPSIFGQDS